MTDIPASRRFRATVAPAHVASATGGQHELRIVSGANQPVPRARLTIDRQVQRIADGSGTIVLPRELLLPGLRRLRIEASGYLPRDVHVEVGATDPIRQRVWLQAVGALPAAAGDGGEAVAIELLLGGGMFVAPWSELTPDPMLDPAVVVADAPIAGKVAASIAASDYGAISAYLVGVAATDPITWTVTPAVAAGSKIVRFIYAGPVCAVWFGYEPGSHAAGTYTITAEHGGTTYGPVVLTVA